MNLAFQRVEQVTKKPCVRTSKAFPTQGSSGPGVPVSLAAPGLLVEANRQEPQFRVSAL